MTEKPHVPSIRDVFESRRQFPRLRSDLPLAVIVPGGGEVDARFFNISPDGVQIRYDKDASGKLFSKNISVKEAKSLSFVLKFSLPGNAGDEAIEIAAKPVYQHLQENGEYAMGLFFDGSNKAMKDKINSFLLYQLEPGGDELHRQFPLENPGAAAPAPGADRTATAGKAATPGSRRRESTVPGSKGAAGGNQELKQELLHIKAMLKDLHEDILSIRQRLDDLDGKS